MLLLKLGMLLLLFPASVLCEDECFSSGEHPWDSLACVKDDEFEKKSLTYCGRQDKTVNDYTCENWHALTMKYGHLIGYKYARTNHSYCRSFGNTESARKKLGPWCYIRDVGKSAVKRRKPCFVRCSDKKEPECYWLKDLPHDQTDYYGDKVTTRTGAKCGYWDADYGNKLSKKCRSMDIKDDQMLKNNKLTRDVFEAVRRPWCFIDSSNKKWDFCHEMCEEKHDCVDITYASAFPYIGDRSTTINKRTCKNWKGQNNYSVEDNNHCRNYNHSPVGPFCPTDDPNFPFEPCFKDCQQKPYCYNVDKGIFYNGFTSKALSGKDCLRWEDPSLLRKYTVQSFGRSPRQFKMWMIANFCRNPDASPLGPWCWTGRNKKEFCFEKCGGDENVENVDKTKLEENKFLAMLREQEKGQVSFNNDFTMIILPPAIVLSVFLCCGCGLTCMSGIKRILIGQFSAMSVRKERKILKRIVNMMKNMPPGMHVTAEGRYDYYDADEEEWKAFDSLKEQATKLRSYIRWRGIADRQMVKDGAKGLTRADLMLKAELERAYFT